MLNSLGDVLTLKKYFNKGSSAMPQSISKKLGGAAYRASRKQRLREQTKFWCGQNFAKIEHHNIKI